MPTADKNGLINEYASKDDPVTHAIKTMKQITGHMTDCVGHLSHRQEEFRLGNGIGDTRRCEAQNKAGPKRLEGRQINNV